MALMHNASGYNIVHGNLDVEGKIYVMMGLAFISHQELVQLSSDMPRNASVRNRLVKMHPTSETTPQDETRNLTNTYLGEKDSNGQLVYKMPLTSYARGMVELALGNGGTVALNKFNSIDLEVPIYNAFVERSKLAFLVETSESTLVSGDRYAIVDGTCYSNRKISTVGKKTIYLYEDNLMVK